LGGLLIGLVSQHIGVKDTVLAEGFIALLIGLLHIRFLKRRRIRKGQQEMSLPGEKDPDEVALIA
jgi:hypothetical protein